MGFNPGSARGGRRGLSSMRYTHFAWYEATISPMRVITPAEGEEEVVRTPEEHVRSCLGIDRAHARGDRRPTLVYFHWPHDDSPQGRIADKVCGRVLDDEEAARWGLLFRCVQVDMQESDEGLAELLGAGNRPSLVVLDRDAEVVDRIKAPSNPRRLARALERSLRDMPEVWEDVEATIEDQERQLEEAEDLAREGELQAALDLINKVRLSDVRVGDVYDEAVREGTLLTRKIERELDED